MTSATQAKASPPALVHPPVSFAIVEMENLFGRGGPGSLIGRAMSRGGIGRQEHRINITNRLLYVPGCQIELLRGEPDGSFAIWLNPVVRRATDDGLVRVSVLHARWTYGLVYRNGARVVNGRGARWVAPMELSEDRIDRLLKSPAPPTSIVNSGGLELHALYALDEPLLLPKQEHHYRRLLTDLAARLGADTPDPNQAIGEIGIPLPGSIVRTREGFAPAETVRAVTMEPEIVYQASDLLHRLTPAK